MKRITLFLLFSLLLSVNVFASRRSIALNRKGMSANHGEYYAQADMPEVYFDSDTQEIIIEADGFSTYYDVDIISQSTMLSVISTQVDGYGDVVDVSSLPDDNYTIVVTSEFDNEYEGQFTNY